MVMPPDQAAIFIPAAHEEHRAWPLQNEVREVLAAHLRGRIEHPLLADDVARSIADDGDSARIVDGGGNAALVLHGSRGPEGGAHAMRNLGDALLDVSLHIRIEGA